MYRVICPDCGASGDPAQAQPGAAPDTVLCPNCGREIAAKADTASTAPPTLPETGPASPPDPSEYIPWEGEGNLLVRLWRTIWLVLLHPVKTLSRPARPGYLRPWAFAVIMGAFLALTELLWETAFFQFETENLALYLLLWAALILGWPFVSAGILHVLLMIVRANNGGYMATFRAVAYANACALLMIRPILGGIVGQIWLIFAIVGGLTGAHRTDMGRVILGVLIIPFMFGLVRMVVGIFL